MERFYRLFLGKLKFSYDSFDRIVINGYNKALYQVRYLHFLFQEVLGHGFVNQDVLISLTKTYKKKVTEYAHQHQLECESLPKKARKDKHVEEQRRRFEKQDRFGVYAILKAIENEATYRVVYPNRHPRDPENRLTRTRKPYTHFYFYIHDEVLGNMAIRIASYLPFKATIFLNQHSYIERYIKRKAGRKRIYRKRENAFLNIKDLDLLMEAKKQFTSQLISQRINYWLADIGPQINGRPVCYQYFVDQAEYSRNFIFKSHFFLPELFRRSCELAMHMLSSDHIKEIFQLSARGDEIRKSLGDVRDGYYVFKAYFKRCSIKQYRKFSNFLRFELTCAGFKAKEGVGTVAGV